MSDQSLADALLEMEWLFGKLGWGRAAGLGRRPAVIVVDAIRAFTTPDCPQALSVDAEVAAIARLLAAARHAEAPVTFVTTGYHDAAGELGSWLEKSPGLGDLREGDSDLDPDPRLARRPEERLLLKKGTSAFFGTDLADSLRAVGIDTCMVVGFTANGCAMATALDARQHGFRTAVVRECVASRLEFLKRVMLCNLSTWADILSLEEAVAYLRSPAGEQMCHGG